MSADIPDTPDIPDIPDTLESEPEAAAEVFGAQLDLARQFAQNLAREGELRGLIGPLELPRLWSRHIINSALLSPLVRAGARVGDVGSGAGLPGLLLAIARPDAHFVLIEPMERRVEWLADQVRALSLDNVEILRQRAEDVDRSISLDQVTARAVSALTKLLPLVTPLARSGGELLLLKGASVASELESARRVIARLRLRSPEILVLGEGVVPEVTRVFRATVA